MSAPIFCVFFVFRAVALGTRTAEVGHDVRTFGCQRNDMVDLPSFAWYYSVAPITTGNTGLSDGADESEYLFCVPARGPDFLRTTPRLIQFAAIAIRFRPPTSALLAFVFVALIRFGTLLEDPITMFPIFLLVIQTYFPGVVFEPLLVQYSSTSPLFLRSQRRISRNVSSRYATSASQPLGVYQTSTGTTISLQPVPSPCVFVEVANWLILSALGTETEFRCVHNHLDGRAMIHTICNKGKHVEST